MKKALICFFAFLLFLLAACARNDGFDAGETLSGEELEALQERLLEEKNHPQELPENAECYYTASGSVYHKDRNCSFLRNAKTVLAGTVEEAQAAGAYRPCSRCAKEKDGEK